MRVPDDRQTENGSRFTSCEGENTHRGGQYEPGDRSYQLRIIKGYRHSPRLSGASISEWKYSEKIS